MTTAPAHASSATPDRTAIRAELEAARRDYHELLNRLTRADWKKPSTNPAWNVGQLMYHVAMGIGFMPSGIANAKKGKGFNPPFANFLNVWSVRLLALRATRPSCKRKYDEGHTKMLAALDQVKNNEWQMGAKNFGAVHTVENLFHSVKEHMDEHAAQIRAAL